MRERLAMPIQNIYNSAELHLKPLNPFPFNQIPGFLFLQFAYSWHWF